MTVAPERDIIRPNNGLLDDLEALLLKLQGRALTDPELDRLARIIYWRGERSVITRAAKRTWTPPAAPPDAYAGLHDIGCSNAPCSCEPVWLKEQA